MAEIKKIKLKNGDIRWGFQVYVGVNPKTRKQATTERRYKTKREANLQLKRIEMQVAEGTYFKKSVTNTNYTFKEVYNKGDNEYKNTVADSTYLKTSGHFNNRILPEIGQYKIEKINHDDIQRLANKWKEFSNCKVWIREISKVFRYAIRHKYTESDPTEFVIIPKFKKNNTNDKFFYEKK